MLAVDPVGLIVTALVTGALIPGTKRILPACGAVLIGETCRLLAALLLAGRVAEMTLGGALSRYAVAEGNPVLVGLVGAGLTALTGLLIGRSMAWSCAIYGVLTAVATLLRF